MQETEIDVPAMFVNLSVFECFFLENVDTLTSIY
jgi:hypothetical protein